MTEVSTFRDSIKEISPPWLSQADGEKLLYDFGLILDALMQGELDGVKSRFPDFAGDEALQLLGADRLIPRGIDESEDSYAARLKRWLDDWKHAGSPYAILRQLSGYLGRDGSGNKFIIRTVNNSGGWHTMNETSEDAIGHVQADPSNWDWDSEPTLWSRFWVIIYPSDLWTNDGTWDDSGTWDDGGTWDTTATPEQVSTIQAIVKLWKAAHSRCPWIIIAFNTDEFEPFDTIASGDLPDGDWKYWHKDDFGNYVHSRFEDASYWDGGDDPHET
jgi:hypothetical protein